MEAVLPRSWKEEFALAAAVKREDILYKEKMLRLEARQRVTREAEHEREERRDREFFEAVTAVFATERQIVEFHVKLDRTDEKTVEALMENRVALDEVRSKLDDILGKAYVMDDGRRVFRTIKGDQVFDEHGIELMRDEFDPEQIADHHPKWESYKATNDTKLALELERKELLDYQARIDAARETLAKDDVTAKELDGLDADLETAMPEAVRRKLGSEAPARETGLTAEVVQPEAVLTGLQRTDQRPAAFSPM
ncbi:hypothetical protein AIGOOFII_3157 [Methylobacterium marchantiae]|nr:hypothetical protein AIGOOFII_3157 [Methylobacterium marchantiae]